MLEEATPLSTRIDTISIVYTNWKGKTAIRRITPLNFYHGSTEYHPKPQWLVDAWDLEKKANRTFALKDIHVWDCN